MTKADPSGGREYPETIEAAVDLVLSRMDDDMKSWMRNFKGDAVQMRVKLAAAMAGMSVRAMLGLWEANSPLIAQMPRGYSHPDSASSYLLIKCWERLRSEPKPRKKRRADPSG